MENKFFNDMVEHIVALAEPELPASVKRSRIGLTNAYIYESRHYLFLISFYKVVAIVNRATMTMYDCLEMHDKYKSRSRTHIKRFREMMGIRTVYRYEKEAK